jgi:cytochrome c-type biogenesis protein
MEFNFPLIFTAGVLSVLSPCIFPIIPSYFAYLSGVEPGTQKTHKKRILFHSILFTLGFSMIFIILGAALGSIGGFLIENKRTIEIIGGIIILLFAIQTTGILNKLSFLQFLNKEKKVHVQLERISYLKSFVAGLVFAFGWSPCYGPIMGSIFTLALVEATLLKGLAFFAIYALGMALSFILIGQLSSKITSKLASSKRFNIIYKTAMFLLLLFLALTMLLGGIGNLANQINDLYIEYNINNFF